MIRSPFFVLPLLTLCIGVANILWAERLSVGGGLGWDGQLYGGWVVHGFAGADDYYVHRFLPSLTVRWSMQALSIRLTTANAIQAFEIYNLILLLLAVLAWCGIARGIGLRWRGYWFGYTCLFLGYVVLKSNFYQPVLTDTTAYALGIVILYFYVNNRPVGLLACAAAGAFTWPLLEYQALLLALVPYRPQADRNAMSGLPSAPPRLLRRNGDTLRASWHVLLRPVRVSWPGRPSGDQAVQPQPFLATDRRPLSSGWEPQRWMAVAAAALLSAAPLLYAYFSLHDNLDSDPYGRYLDVWKTVDKSLLPVSILAVVAYLALSITTLLRHARLPYRQDFWRSLAWRRVPAIAGVALGGYLLAAHLSNGTPSIVTTGYTINYSVLISIVRPLVFLVAHAVYWGPFVLLTAFHWRRFCHELPPYGVALTLLVLGTLLAGIDSQSRFLLTLAPIFVMVLARIVDASAWRWPHYILWTLLYFAYSKVWFIIDARQQSLGDEASLFRFPLQGLFMNSGSWMSERMYYVQGGAVLLTAAIILVAILPASRAAGTAPREYGWRRVVQGALRRGREGESTAPKQPPRLENAP